MEISSIPFLNHEDDSNFYSLLQDLAPNNIDTTLLSLDEQEKSRAENWNVESNEQPNIQSMDDFYPYFKELYNGITESGRLPPVKRARSNSDTTSELPQRSHQSLSTLLSPDKQVKSEEEHLNQNDITKSDLLPKIEEQSVNATTAQGGGNGGGNGGAGKDRRLWVKERSKAWWDFCNSQDFPEEEFKRTFRMSKATFDMICEELGSVVTKKDTALRLAVPVRQRVAVCIWRLATGEPLRAVSKRFGLGISTCFKLVLEVCAAIKTVLMPKLLRWPDQNKLKEISSDFQTLSGIPNVIGSMYTTHVRIIGPKNSGTSYFNKRHTDRNRKTSYSITVQGVVDAKGVFTDVCIGWPGSFSDERVLEKSAIFQKANGGLLRGVWLVGHSGYPLMDWVLVPYNHQNLTWPQHWFNEKIEENQRVAKEAFMRLKARWTCLQKRTEMKLQDLPVVLVACCVLHNICEINNESLDPELRFDLFDDEMVAENSLRSVRSMQVRDHVALNLFHQNIGGTTFKCGS